MKQQGTVIERKNGNILEIKITPHESCHKCGACSTKSIKKITFCGDIPEDIKLGDNVEVEAESGYLVFSYFLFYVVPLISFFSILLIVYKFTVNPLISFVAGACGMIFSYVFIGIFFKKHHQFSRHLKIRKI